MVDETFLQAAPRTPVPPAGHPTGKRPRPGVSSKLAAGRRQSSGPHRHAQTTSQLKVAPKSGGECSGAVVATAKTTSAKPEVAGRPHENWTAKGSGSSWCDNATAWRSLLQAPRPRQQLQAALSSRSGDGDLVRPLRRLPARGSASKPSEQPNSQGATGTSATQLPLAVDCPAAGPISRALRRGHRSGPHSGGLRSDRSLPQGSRNAGAASAAEDRCLYELPLDEAAPTRRDLVAASPAFLATASGGLGIGGSGRPQTGSSDN